jgi:hypothetical protein
LSKVLQKHIIGLITQENTRIMQNKISVKDFFLHVAVMALLYVGTIALLNLLFRVINVAFPQIDQSYRYYSMNISLPVATLIVVLPLFLVIMNVLRKSYQAEPEKINYPVRRWLIFITLFVAGGILAGDLITLIYFFLDGRELTIGFLLKILTIFVVIGSVFGYYLDDLKDRLNSSRRNLWRIGAIVLVVGSIIAGFSVIGSPATQRALRIDGQKVNDLQNIQGQIISYWQQKGILPVTLDDLRDSVGYFIIPSDPQTNESYQYDRTGNLSFELCAVFNRQSEDYSQTTSRPAMDFYVIDENWQHGEGRHCFDRTIDPDRYSIKPR